MKVYFPIQTREDDSLEVLAALKNFFEKQFPGFKPDPVVTFKMDLEDVFILSNSQTIILGKVYLRSIGFSDLEKLRDEIKTIQAKFQHRIQANVFFKDSLLESGSKQGIPLADYFKYSFIQSGEERALMLEKMSWMLPETILSENRRDFRGKEDYRFSRYFQLSRQELTDFVDLSLDLKRDERVISP